MKSHSYSKATVLTLTVAAGAFVLVAWPVPGRGQDSSRRDRDRYRREMMTRMVPGRSEPGRPSSATPSGASRSEPSRRDAAAPSESTKTQAARPGTGEQAGRITKSAEPNVPVRPVERRSPRRVARPEQWAPYEIITQRNMFSRLRVPFRPQEQQAVEERPRVMPNPESYLLLKGIVQEDNQFIAFVEDKQSGGVLRLHEGDPVARGTVKSLTLDALEYQMGDQTVTVGLGFDLEGGSGAVTAGDLAAYSPTFTPSGSTPSATPSADEAEILKRLMEQRKQQMGQ